VVGLEPGNGIFIQLEFLLQVQLGAPKFSLRSRREKVKEEGGWCTHTIPGAVHFPFLRFLPVFPEKEFDF
jgi:hypothetical protein